MRVDADSLDTEEGRRELLEGNGSREPQDAISRGKIEDKRSRRRKASDVAGDVKKTKQAIVNARSSSQPEFARNAHVVELVTAAFHKRGNFFHDTLRSYFFLTDARVLLPIEQDVLGLELLLHDYGLFPNESVTKQVLHGLRLEAHGRGREITAHSFAFYSRASNTVYVYDFDGGVYRITEASIEHVDNGTDGILFPQNPRWTPLQLTGRADGVDWRSWLFNGLAFAEGSLSIADQKTLVAVWILALFFPQLFPTRIILALIGEKGSGKSSLVRRLGKVVFGPKFDVSMLSSKPDDFDAAVTTDSLLIVDNADKAPGWFPDKLAVVATGGTIKRRLLYTTNKLGDFPITATVAVTSRTPNFRREDIVERLLPLTFAHLDSYTPESELLTECEVRRREIVEAILQDVQRALGELHLERDAKYRTKFRMADFADFALKIAPVLCSRDEMRTLLDRVSGQQVAFSSEDEPLLDLLDRWLADDSEHINIGRDVPSARLAAELERTESEAGVPWERGNLRSFGQYLRERKGTLRDLYRMTERTARGNATCYTFWPRRSGGLGELGDSIPDLSFLLDVDQREEQE